MKWVTVPKTHSGGSGKATGFGARPFSLCRGGGFIILMENQKIHLIIQKIFSVGEF
jgi:hypothetical protein